MLISSILLISFATFNLSTSIFAEEPTKITLKCYDEQDNLLDACAKPMDLFWMQVFENLIGVALPYVGGAVIIGIEFARKQGLKISADAEE